MLSVSDLCWRVSANDSSSFLASWHKPQQASCSPFSFVQLKWISTRKKCERGCALHSRCNTNQVCALRQKSPILKRKGLSLTKDKRGCLDAKTGNVLRVSVINILTSTKDHLYVKEGSLLVLPFGALKPLSQCSVTSGLQLVFNKLLFDQNVLKNPCTLPDQNQTSWIQRD